MQKQFVTGLFAQNTFFKKVGSPRNCSCNLLKVEQNVFFIIEKNNLIWVVDNILMMTLLQIYSFFIFLHKKYYFLLFFKI